MLTVVSPVLIFFILEGKLRYAGLKCGTSETYPRSIFPPGFGLSDDLYWIRLGSLFITTHYSLLYTKKRNCLSQKTCSISNLTTPFRNLKAATFLQNWTLIYGFIDRFNFSFVFRDEKCTQGSGSLRHDFGFRSVYQYRQERDLYKGYAPPENEVSAYQGKWVSVDHILYSTHPSNWENQR